MSGVKLQSWPKARQVLVTSILRGGKMVKLI